MLKNKYVPTTLSLYINFFVHGMGLIIIAQNMGMLAEQWNTDNMGVAQVISMFGIGRLVVLFFSGKLSDMFGRKLFVYLGIFTYMIALIGFVLSSTVPLAMVFGILAGAANSLLDSGTYPALIESFPENAGTANMLLVIFIRLGQFALPLIISAIVAANAWYGWSFILCVAILALSAIYLINKPFPDHKAAPGKTTENKAAAVTFSEKAKNHIEGVCCCLFGYISMATMLVINQWITEYGMQVASMGETSARALMSYVSLGSIACVVVSTALYKKIKSYQLMPLFTLMSTLTIAIIWAFPSPAVLTIASFAAGFSISGGVLQIGLTLMAEMFPAGKGLITSIYMTLGSAASFTVPLITAQISLTDVRSVMLFGILVAAIGFVLALIISYRYQKVFKEWLQQTKAA